jgi:hypothetical protein
MEKMTLSNETKFGTAWHDPVMFLKRVPTSMYRRDEK